VDKKFVEQGGRQERQERMGLGVFLADELPGGLVFFA
jgi:hypothetical protein